MRSATKFLIPIILLFSIKSLHPKDESIGKINFILGKQDEIKHLKYGEGNWCQAKLYSDVQNGDKIKTQKESRCEVKLEDQSIIRIGEKTEFRLQKGTHNIKESSSLSFGKIWFNIKKIFQKDKFTIKTPTAVCSIRGTIFRIDSDSTTRIAVYDGSVDVGPVWMSHDVLENQRKSSKSLKPYEVPGPHEIPPPFEVSLEQWIQIVKGYQIEIKNNGKYSKTKIDSTLDESSDWIKWNKERDKLFE